MGTAVSDANQPVWKLVFNAGSELHGATVPWLFDANSANDNSTLAAIMKDWFLSFAVNLNPNSQSWSDNAKPHWPQYTSQISTGAAAGQGNNFVVIEVNATNIAVMTDPDASDRCDFFHGQSYVVRN